MSTGSRWSMFSYRFWPYAWPTLKLTSSYILIWSLKILTITSRFQIEPSNFQHVFHVLPKKNPKSNPMLPKPTTTTPLPYSEFYSDALNFDIIHHQSPPPSPAPSPSPHRLTTTIAVPSITIIRFVPHHRIGPWGRLGCSPSSPVPWGCLGVRVFLRGHRGHPTQHQHDAWPLLVYYTAMSFCLWPTGYIIITMLFQTMHDYYTWIFMPFLFHSCHWLPRN